MNQLLYASVQGIFKGPFFKKHTQMTNATALFDTFTCEINTFLYTSRLMKAPFLGIAHHIVHSRSDVSSFTTHPTPSLFGGSFDIPFWSSLALINRNRSQSFSACLLNSSLSSGTSDKQCSTAFVKLQGFRLSQWAAMQENPKFTDKLGIHWS